MNKFIGLLAVLILSAAPAFAWNCPAGQIRQQAPAGTPTNTPYYDVVEGIAFICVPSTPTTGTTSNNASSTSNSASNSTSASNSNSSATGGSAVANGGSATGGSSSVSNSNHNVAQGGSGGQGGAGGTASATAGNSSSGSGNQTSINETTNVAADRFPANTAYAAAPYPTAQCYKGYGVGGQSTTFGFSVNGGKIDENCAILETARSFDNVGERLAACKVKISNKYAKKAGVTLEDCLKASEPVVVPQVQTPAPTPVPIIVNLPAPVINVTPAPVTIQQMPPAQTPAPVFVAPKPHKKIVPPKGSGIKPCPTSYSKTDICLEND